MAEEQQSKGIGQLFVEFGAKGLPSLLKGLNTVSASFLLGKNAANQFVQTLTQPAKEAGKTAVEIGKMSNALGISYKEYMKLRAYIKSHSLSEGLIDDISNLQKVFQDFNYGIGSIPKELSIALERSGHNITEYSGDFESILRLIKDLERGTQGTDKNYRNQTLRQAGLSSEWGYAFDRGFDLSKYTTVSDDKVEALIKSQEAMAKLATETEQLKMHLIQKLSPAIANISNWLSKWVNKGASGELDKPVANAYNSGAKILSVSSSMGQSKILNKSAKDIAQNIKNGQNPIDALLDTVGSYREEISRIEGQLTGGAAPIVPSFMKNGHIPPNLTSSNMTINVTNENRVNVGSPEDAGKAIGSISKETLTNIEYNQFQLANQTGI